MNPAIPPEPVILLVEDNPDDVLMVRRALGRLARPLRLIALEHGDAAVDYFMGAGGFGDRARHPLPSVVLLDLKLPRRSGHEVLAWMRQQPALNGLPVVILTASAEDEDVRKAYGAHVNSYLRKPVAFADLADLLAMVERYWIQANISPSLSGRR